MRAAIYNTTNAFRDRRGLTKHYIIYSLKAQVDPESAIVVDVASVALEIFSSGM